MRDALHHGARARILTRRWWKSFPWSGLRELYLRWHHSILIALVLAGTLLSSMHQSFLGGLYLITKGKLDPLWYTPYLTTMFYLSAIPAGLAVTIMAIYLCIRSLNVRVDMSILSDVSRVISPLLAIYGVFRAVDLINRGATQYLWMWRREETQLFWLEIALLVIAPLVLLSKEKVRKTPQYLYWTCAVIVMGFMTNRLNVSVTASAGQFSDVLHAEMDRVCRLFGDDHCRHGGFSLRRNLFGHSAQELAAAAGHGFPCSRACVSGRVSAEAPGETARGFSIGVETVSFASTEVTCEERAGCPTICACFLIYCGLGILHLGG